MKTLDSLLPSHWMRTSAKRSPLRGAGARSRRAAGSAGERGQSLIEFTFSFPLLLALLIGLAGMSWLFYSYVTVTLAAREGASAIVHDPYITVDQVRGIVRGKSISLIQANLPDSNIIVEPNPSQWVSGARVSVTVKYLVPLPSLSIPDLKGNRILILGPIEVRATSNMTID